MKNLPLSTQIFLLLICILALLTAVSIFLPQGNLIPGQELPASKPVLAVANAILVLVLYGGLGLLGIYLSGKIGLPPLWDNKITAVRRFLHPALIGTGIGIFFIAADLLFQQLRGLQPLPHPPFPTSLVASATAGIGEEILFRLFFISLWVWILSHLLLKKRWFKQIFWIVSVFSALVFAGAHLPSLMILSGFKAVGDIPPFLLVEVLLLNGVLSLFAAAGLKKYGFLAAAGIHFWADVIWHVLWGGLQ